MRRRVLAGIAVAVGIFASGGAAHADAIDGDWCHADGRRLSIRGPDMVTPGGHQIVGDYNRHGFVYVVPPGEAGTGDKVVMTLLSETLMHSRQGGDDAPVQVWNRCRPTVSALPAALRSS